AIVLLDAKKNGVLRRLQLTPMKPLQIYTGFLAGRCVIVLAHLLVLSLVAIALFRAQILSSVPAAIFVVVLGILCFMPMAGVVAMLSPSFEAGNIIIQLLNFPMAFLCGVFFRNENMPHILQAVVKFMPLTYLVDLMRGTIQAGLPLNRFPLQIAVLSAWSAASLIVIALSGRVKALSRN
ncbi:MAG: ABC transporter permease, partial [Candidatus Sulfotelmatobacter sp.]